MIIKEENLTQIKKTKSVSMQGNREGVEIWMEKYGMNVWIPMNTVFQVKRGLESYIQKYYRKNDRHIRKNQKA